MKNRLNQPEKKAQAKASGYFFAPKLVVSQDCSFASCGAYFLDAVGRFSLTDNCL
jgi:hypothetical protein